MVITKPALGLADCSSSVPLAALTVATPPTSWKVRIREPSGCTDQPSTVDGTGLAAAVPDEEARGVGRADEGRGRGELGTAGAGTAAVGSGAVVAGNATRRSGTAASSTGRTPHQHTAMPARVAALQVRPVRVAFQPRPMVTILACRYVARL